MRFLPWGDSLRLFRLNHLLDERGKRLRLLSLRLRLLLGLKFARIDHTHEVIVGEVSRDALFVRPLNIVHMYLKVVQIRDNYARGDKETHELLAY